MPGAAQLVGERGDAGGQPLRVVEKYYLGYRNSSREDDILCYPALLWKRSLSLRALMRLPKGSTEAVRERPPYRQLGE